MRQSLHSPDGRPVLAPASPAASLRLTPLRSTTRVVARERLLAALIAVRRRRCIVLQGPAGCGKTALLTAWRLDLLALGFDMAWLTVEPTDNDLSRWLDRLLGCLSQVSPAITREAMLLAGRGVDDEAVERCIITLVRGIAGYPLELMLVLDELHHLSAPRAHQALQWLIDYAPANLHVVLASRATVPLSLGRLRDQGMLLELDQRDLRFTLAESQQFLTAQLGDIGARDARLLHELTDGWVAGLQLFATHWKRKKQHASGHSFASGFVRVNVQNAGAFADYFEREVMSRLTPNEAELLVHAAACERFSASLCVALSGRAQSEAEVLALLARLESESLFITPLEGPGRETWYRLHPLLRETLAERFRSRSETEQRAVHAAAWHWFRNHHLLEEAVRHAVPAGEATTAANLVQRYAGSLIARGQMRNARELLRFLPPEQIQARIGLRLLTLQVQIYARELEASFASIERLDAEIPAADTYHRYRLTVLHFGLKLLCDDTEGAQSLLPQLLHTPEDIDPIYIGKRSNLLPWLYMHLGEYERARRILTEAAPVLVEGAPLMGTTGGALNGRCMMAFSYALEGKMTLAERVSRDVLRDVGQVGGARAESEYFAAAVLGEVLYEHNDMEGVRRLLEDRVDMLERISIPDSVLRVHTVLAAVHWISGHRIDAFAHLERLEEYAVKFRLDRLRAHSLASQISQHLHCGDLEAAASVLTRLDTVAALHQNAQRGSLDAIHLVREHSHILVSLAHEKLDEAAQRIAPLIDFCEAHGWQRHVAQLQVLTAMIAFHHGDQEAAHEQIVSALRLGHRLGLMRSLIDIAPGALDLIVDLAGGKTFDPLLAFYVERFQAAAQPPVRSTANPTQAAGAADNGAEELSDREADVIRLLGQALPNKKIANTLGLSPETVKWHLRNIFRKLGVASRHEAVAKARDRDLCQGG